MRSSQIFNLISIVFLSLSVLVIGGVAYLMTQPPTALDNEEVFTGQLPTQFVPPTATETPFLSPTFTELPPTFTQTFTPSVTVPATETTTPTHTMTVTSTASPTITSTIITDTPENTATPTDTPGPSQTPLPVFLFGLDESVAFETNFANTLGCEWQGLGGQVFDLTGREWIESDLQVRVSTQDNSFSRTTTIGTNSLYGERSGYEITLRDRVTTELFFVQLLSPRGTAISDIVQVRFPAECNQNVAILNWVQLREAN